MCLRANLDETLKLRESEEILGLYRVYFKDDSMKEWVSLVFNQPFREHLSAEWTHGISVLPIKMLTANDYELSIGIHGYTSYQRAFVEAKRRSLQALDGTGATFAIIKFYYDPCEILGVNLLANEVVVDFCYNGMFLTLLSSGEVIPPKSKE